MTSSNQESSLTSFHQEEDFHLNPSPSTTNHLNNDVVDPPSSSPPPPPPPMPLPLWLPLTPNYATYPPHSMSHTTSIGYPYSIPDNRHNLHGYPQGHFVYMDDKFSSTMYPTKSPPPLLDSNNNPHAYPKGQAIYTENGLTTKQPGGCPNMSPYYGPPPTHHNLTKKDKMLRVFIFLCCLFLLAIIIAQFYLTFTSDSDLPFYELTSMNVTNFITTPTLLSGKWDITFNLETPGDLVSTYYYSLQVSLMYKDNIVVAMKNESGFILELGKTKEVQVNGWSNSTSQGERAKNVREQMAKDRISSGSITFSFKVFAVAEHKSSSFISLNYQEMMQCTRHDLKVLFHDQNSTTGTMDNASKNIKCFFSFEP